MSKPDFAIFPDTFAVGGLEGSPIETITAIREDSFDGDPAYVRIYIVCTNKTQALALGPSLGATFFALQYPTSTPGLPRFHEGAPDSSGFYTDTSGLPRFHIQSAEYAFKFIKHLQ